MSQTDARDERHRVPPALIAHAVWLYLRFSLSLRAVEELLLERGVEVSYETLRRWVAKFGPVIARDLRRRQGCPGRVWHLDEVQVSVRGRRSWLWRAVDERGVVLEEIVQPRRDKKAAKRLLRRLLKTAGRLPKRIVTDKPGSYAPAKREIAPGLERPAPTRPNRLVAVFPAIIRNGWRTALRMAFDAGCWAGSGAGCLEVHRYDVGPRQGFAPDPHIGADPGG